MPPFHPASKRPSFVNFPIPFDHPYILPTLLLTVSASSLVYYYLQATHAADLIEAVRHRDIRRRRTLKRPEERYASLKIDRLFVNPFKEWQPVSWWVAVLFWFPRWRRNGVPKSIKALDESLPIQTPSFDIIFPTTEMSASLENPTPEITFTWLGHSSCLMTIGGITVLTDPVFTDCLGPPGFGGPKRLRPPPCGLKDIQDKIDIVLVSHNHFDHLDESVVRTLGNSVTWYTPLGLRDWFVNLGVDNVIELDWWQEIHHKETPDIVIACVPTMHWSGMRKPFDVNQTLWCSFVVRSSKHRLFFCGDGGYVPDLFKAIGEKYGPFELAALPIGGHETNRPQQHMSAEQAVQVHKAIGCPRVSVGIHWGTFMLSNEHYLAPQKFIEQCGEKGFKTTALGETLSL
ncbi:beta-lactamase superfamily domain-containing protein [Phycomyces blakesleeanus]